MCIRDRARTQDPSLRDWSIIVDRAYSREPAAMHVLEKEAGYLAAAITTAANIVDFDAVVQMCIRDRCSLLSPHPRPMKKEK